MQKSYNYKIQSPLEAFLMWLSHLDLSCHAMWVVIVAENMMHLPFEVRFKNCFGAPSALDGSTGPE